MPGRLDALLACRTLGDVLERTGIRYWPRCDARHLPPALHGADAHVSFTVFEHIPEAVLEGIVAECARTLAPGGAAVHLIDLSDHFAHVDPSILRIHFLRFSDGLWQRIAGNRFAYHNRLRKSAYVRLAQRAGMDIVAATPYVDAPALAALYSGFPVAAPFHGLAAEDLAVTGLDLVLRPARA